MNKVMTNEHVASFLTVDITPPSIVSAVPAAGTAGAIERTSKKPKAKCEGGPGQTNQRSDIYSGASLKSNPPKVH